MQKPTDRPSYAPKSRASHPKRAEQADSPAVRHVARHSVDAIPAITRRQFLVGAAGMTAAAAVATGAYTFATGSGDDKANASQTALSVPAERVFDTEQCEYLQELNGSLSLRTRAALPYGTILTASCDSVAACLIPTESANPLIEVALLHLGSGRTTTAIKKAVGAADGFQVFDARAAEAGLVWVEANLLNGAWRVYTATLDGADVGEPVLAAEGDGSWTIPTLVVSTQHAWWQTAPKDTNSAQNATLCRIPFAAPQDQALVVAESPGGFACSPSPGYQTVPAGNTAESPDGETPEGETAPPATISGVCGALRLSAKSKTWHPFFVPDTATEPTNTLTLPSTMKPMDVSYGPNGFGLSLDAIYEFKDGISNLGTYMPAMPVTLTTEQAVQKALSIEESTKSQASNTNNALTDDGRSEAETVGELAVCEAYSQAEWFRYPRAPISSPAFNGDWMFVKSTNVVAAVNIAARTYVTIPTESAMQGYGEYLASCGTATRTVTFANVDYTPMEGDRLRECTVRVWETL